MLSPPGTVHRFRSVTLSVMSENARGEQKPGTGIDRTLIRQMLALTPADRLRSLVEEARNLEQLFAKNAPAMSAPFDPFRVLRALLALPLAFIFKR